MYKALVQLSTMFAHLMFLGEFYFCFLLKAMKLWKYWNVTVSCKNMQHYSTTITISRSIEWAKYS